MMPVARPFAFSLKAAFIFWGNGGRRWGEGCESTPVSLSKVTTSLCQTVCGVQTPETPMQQHEDPYNMIISGLHCSRKLLSKNIDKPEYWQCPKGAVDAAWLSQKTSLYCRSSVGSGENLFLLKLEGSTRHVKYWFQTISVLFKCYTLFSAKTWNLLCWYKEVSTSRLHFKKSFWIKYIFM